MGKFQNLENTILGNWKILYRVKDNNSGKKPVTMWRCECLVCGKQYDVRANALKSGASTQCVSCSYKYRTYNKRKSNEYIEKNDYIVGVLNNGERFYIDKENYDEISKFYWTKMKNGYLYTRHNKELFYLHRLIMNSELKNSDKNENYIDHINHNKLDNRKCNLRVVSKSENQRNRVPTNNEYNVSGVYYAEGAQKYVARIHVENQKISLGCFEKLEDAIKARKEAEEKYFGEYSYDNSMKYSIDKKI